MINIFSFLLLVLSMSLGSNLALETLDSLNGDPCLVMEFLDENNEVLNSLLNELEIDNYVSGIDEYFRCDTKDEDVIHESYMGIFNDDEGYIILGNDYECYGLEIDCKNPFKEYLEYEKLYDTTQGFFYFKDNTYLSVEETSNVGTDFEVGSIF